METNLLYLVILAIAVIRTAYAVSQCSVPAVGQNFMGVTFGDGCAENATDGNLNTCATSGFNLNKWVVIDLGSVQTFRSIKLAGKVDRMRIYTAMNQQPLGLMRITDRSPCSTWELRFDYKTMHVIPCSQSQTARYVIIESTDVNTNQMKVCEVEVVP